ncbi:MAG: hydroxymethylglutaryl-CoA lyase [Fimbriimonadales bacterium]|nr:hydroxymethylglutaryl-CoA lyase [Fimbriimonadales bacterium]
MSADPIKIVEVGPRDGLQNEKSIIPTETKIAFVDALSSSGLTEIEVSSFVSPKWVPQLADALEVFRGITRVPGVVYSALVPNEVGLDRAIEAKVDKFSVFTAASETFSQKNVGASIAETIKRFRPVLQRSPVPVRGYVSTAFYCPYEGKIEPNAVVPVIEDLLDIGCVEISIGDTIGKAIPEEVTRLLEVTLDICPVEKIAMHFHDTFGNAIANSSASERMGVRVFDSSAGGIGGCPFAPGATGNVSTTALVRLFEGRTGISLEKLEEAAKIVRPFLTR